jgi:hypothetical protein
MKNNFGTDQGASVCAVCGTAKSWVVIQDAQVTSPAGAQTQADANCPSGLIPVAGGVSTSSSSTLVNINSTFPVPGGPWRSFENNASAIDDVITPYAVCVL